MSDNDDMTLVDVSTLKANLANGQVDVLLDCRWSLGKGVDTASYQLGHIPGALLVDFDADICGTPGENGRHPLPQPEALQQACRRLGINNGDAIVLYDGGDMMASSRTWWTLRWAGVETVQVLDGGYSAWIGANGDVTAEVPSITPGDLVVQPGNMPIAHPATDHSDVLLDVRAPERFRGDIEPIDPVAGHIPGAVNLPGSDVIDSSGGFIDEKARRVRYADLTDQSVTVYCGSGVTAAREVLAMTATSLPLEPALYVGSWSEWITAPGRDVVTGD